MIIGLCSKVPRVGKDTVGLILTEDFMFNRVAFGDSIKEYCAKYHGYRGEKFKNEDRHILIDIGTEKRKEDKEFWIKQTENKIDMFYSVGDVVITDVRMKEEEDFLRSCYDCYMVEVRSNVRGLNDLKGNITQKDIKEMKIDYVIQNDYHTIDPLIRDVNKMYYHFHEIYSFDVKQKFIQGEELL